MAQNLKINILAQDKTKQAFNGIRGRLAGLKDAVLSVKGALVGIGAGLVIKQFVDVGRTVEDLQVRLKQLFGSTQEGTKAFQVMRNFASEVPFSLEQIQMLLILHCFHEETFSNYLKTVLLSLLHNYTHPSFCHNYQRR